MAVHQLQAAIPLLVPEDISSTYFLPKECHLSPVQNSPAMLLTLQYGYFQSRALTQQF